MSVRSTGQGVLVAVKTASINLEVIVVPDVEKAFIILIEDAEASYTF